MIDLRGDAIVAAWSRGDIDGAYVWAPAKSKLLANGGSVFKTWDKLDAAGYVIADTIVARPAFAEQQPHGGDGAAEGLSARRWTSIAPSPTRRRRWSPRPRASAPRSRRRT